MRLLRRHLAFAGLAAALALGLSVAGCGGETDPADAADAMVGTYALISVDGDPLPATPFAGLTITGGSIDLRRDRSYVARIKLESEDDSEEDVGTWILNGDELTLVSASSTSSSETAVVSDGGRVLTLEAGITYVFRR